MSELSPGGGKAKAMQTREITVYIDYKSPYAYLAVAPAYSLEIDGPVGGCGR